jgi:hypothetical protein
MTRKSIDEFLAAGPQAALAKLANTERARAQQWEGLTALVKAGRLVKARGYSYRVIDPTVIKEIGQLVQGIELYADGKLSRVKLERPDPKLLKEIEALLPKRH